MAGGRRGRAWGGRRVHTGVRDVKLLLSLLICAAILLSALTAGVLILWWKGVGAIALPGLGLIVATPLLALLLLIVAAAVILAAVLAGSPKGGA